MKAFLLALALYYVPHKATGQASLADIYNNHQFSCDSEGTSLAVNICTGEKSEFADSLLNSLYKKILRSIDKELFRYNKEAKQKPANKKDSADVKFAIKQRGYYFRLKQGMVNSQKQWIKLRDQNAQLEAILCEGGTACVAIVNEAYIEDTLDRIRKLESFDLRD